MDHLRRRGVPKDYYFRGAVTMCWPTAALPIALKVLNRRGDGQRLR